MRKLIWCGAAAGMMVIAGMIAVSYYAGCHPHSTVGRCIKAATRAALVIQPAARLGTAAIKGSHATPANQPIPAEPQPIAAPAAEEPAEAGAADKAAWEENHDTSPIVIKEEELMPPPKESVDVPPPSIQLNEKNIEVPDSACPMFMPFCDDEDDEPAAKEKKKDKSEEKNPLKANADESFKEWMKFIKGAEEANETTEIPDLPPSAPKCQEDVHRNEQYPGCPHTTGPRKAKSSPSAKPEKKSGSHPQGVDTMEFRKSDGRLDEFGRGPF